MGISKVHIYNLAQFTQSMVPNCYQINIYLINYQNIN